MSGDVHYPPTGRMLAPAKSAAHAKAAPGAPFCAYPYLDGPVAQPAGVPTADARLPTAENLTRLYQLFGLKLS
jgi:hypothetical protein